MPFRRCWTHRALIASLALREISSRWRGSFLGPLWALAMPLFLLATYTFVFSTVFRARWSVGATEGEPHPPFALVLFSGLILFNLFAEVINTSPSLIRNNVTYVKQVVFPLEILPVVTFLAALFNAAVSTLVLIVAYLILIGPPPVGAMWVVLAVLPLPFLTLGLAWFLAALGTFVRDTAQVAAMSTTILLFLCPLLYPVEAIPAQYRIIIMANPLTMIVTQVRGALFSGARPEFARLAIGLAVAFAVFLVGYWFFRRTKEAFADVV